MENLVADIEVVKIMVNKDKMNFPDNKNDPRMDEIKKLSEQTMMIINTVESDKCMLFQKLVNSSIESQTESSDSESKSEDQSQTNISTIPQLPESDICKYNNILISAKRCSGKTTLVCSLIGNAGIPRDCSSYFGCGFSSVNGFLDGFTHLGDSKMIYKNDNCAVNSFVEKFSNTKKDILLRKSLLVVMEDACQEFFDQLGSSKWESFLHNCKNFSSSSMNIFTTQEFPITTRHTDYIFSNGFEMIFCGKTSAIEKKRIWRSIAYKCFPDFESFVSAFDKITSQLGTFMVFTLGKNPQVFWYKANLVLSQCSQYSLYNKNIEAIHDILIDRSMSEITPIKKHVEGEESKNYGSLSAYVCNPLNQALQFIGGSQNVTNKNDQSREESSSSSEYSDEKSNDNKENIEKDEKTQKGTGLFTESDEESSDSESEENDETEDSEDIDYWKNQVDDLVAYSHGLEKEIGYWKKSLLFMQKAYMHQERRQERM